MYKVFWVTCAFFPYSGPGHGQGQAGSSLISHADADAAGSSLISHADAGSSLISHADAGSSLISHAAAAAAGSSLISHADNDDGDPPVPPISPASPTELQNGYPSHKKSSYPILYSLLLGRKVTPFLHCSGHFFHFWLLRSCAVYHSKSSFNFVKNWFLGTF